MHRPRTLSFASALVVSLVRENRLGLRLGPSYETTGQMNSNKSVFSLSHTASPFVVPFSIRILKQGFTRLRERGALKQSRHSINVDVHPHHAMCHARDLGQHVALHLPLRDHHDQAP